MRVIAAAGGAKKDILERSISSELEQLMERRECYERGADEQPEVLISSQDGCAVVAAAPIITDGDVSGCVAFVSEKEDEKADEVLLKLCQSAAQFLSKRIAVKGAFSICTGTITKSVSQRPSRSTTMRRILTRQQWPSCRRGADTRAERRSQSNGLHGEILRGAAQNNKTAEAVARII